MSIAAKRKIAGTKPGGTHKTGPGGLDAEAFAGWYRAQSIEQWESLDLTAIGKLADALETVRQTGRTVYVMGNGGSAASASHIACDFSKTAQVKGRKPLRCVSLAENNAFITAVGNDLSFDDIFSRQLENVLEKGDLVLLVTGSGNSRNMLKAAALARSRKARTAALLGFDGGKLLSRVDIPLLVASDQYGVVEDMHMAICHVLTFFIKQRR